MRCPSQNPESADILLAYCARRLDAPATARIEQHLVECAGCREFAQGQQAVWSALDAWTPEPVSLGFNRALYSKIEADERQPMWRRWLKPAIVSSPDFRPAFSLALTCSVLLGVVLVGSVDRLHMTAPKEPDVRIERVDVEQVEQALEDLDMLQKLAPQQRQHEDARRAEGSRM